MRWFFAILFIIGGGIGAFFAIDSVLWQDRAVRYFVPVPAAVVSSEVGIHRGKHTSYSADITYNYVYHDTAYRSSRVLPFSEQGSSSWARAIVSQYPVARGIERRPNVTAYVDPDSPGDAVLVRQYSSTPYLLSLLACGGCAVGIGMALGLFSAARTRMEAIALDETTARLILPTKSLQGQFRASLILLVLAVIATAPIFLHYPLVARQNDAWAQIVGAGLLLLYLMLAVRFFRRWSVARHVSDARVRVLAVPLVRGQTANLEIEADAFAPLRIREVRAQAACIEHYKERRGNKTYYGTRNRAIVESQAAGNTDVPAGQMVSGQTSLLIPEDAPPSSSDTVSYPWYHWELRIKIVMNGTVDYSGVFPVEVT